MPKQNPQKTLLSQPKTHPAFMPQAACYHPLRAIGGDMAAIKTDNLPVCGAIIKGGFIGRAVRAAFRASDLQ